MAISPENIHKCFFVVLNNALDCLVFLKQKSRAFEPALTNNMQNLLHDFPPGNIEKENVLHSLQKVRTDL